MCKKWKHCCVRCNICNNIVTKQYKIMISNLLLLYTSTLTQCGCAFKGFISSKILHLCFYSLGHQFHMLDLLQLQEPGLNYICYRNLADMRFSWPGGCRKLIFKSCSTLHSSSYLHATYLFRRKDSVVILPKHASPVMLNEPASASSSAVRLYALELTGLKKW